MNADSSEDLPVRRIDRILAFMSLGLLALAIACFFAIMIGSSSGANMQQGIWPAISVTVIIAPIAAFAALLTVLIMSFARRARAARGH